MLAYGLIETDRDANGTKETLEASRQRPMVVVVGKGDDPDVQLRSGFPCFRPRAVTTSLGMAASRRLRRLATNPHLNQAESRKVGEATTIGVIVGKGSSQAPARVRAPLHR